MGVMFVPLFRAGGLVDADWGLGSSRRLLGPAGLTKGAEAYVEGRLSMSTWKAKDGTQRTGLSVSAWPLMPLG
jgi:hypothetical protein